MMTFSPRRALLAGAMSLICAAASAATHTYTYTLIAVPNAASTNPIAINKAGVVLGYWNDQYYNEHGFTYQNGTITSFDVPNSVNTIPTGIDDKGAIVGTYQDANYNSHGFTLSARGVFKSVDLPGSTYTGFDTVSRNGIAVGGGTDSSGNLEVFTYKKGVFTTAVDNGQTPIPSGINNKGAIAGTFEAPHTYETGFLYENGTLTTISSPNFFFVQSYGINNEGVVVGQVANTMGQEFGFTFKNGVLKAFGPPGSTDSFFTGINDHNLIAGVTFDANYNSSGFVYDHGDFSTLSINGVQGVGATGINESGLVIGDYYDNTGSKTFLATPSN